MPYPNDLVGKLVQYTIHQGTTTLPPRIGGHRPSVLANQTTLANLAVYTEQPGAPAVAIGGHRRQYTNTRNNWSFHFLKYAAGAVTNGT